MTDKQFYRPDELADRLQVCLETVYRWIRKEQIRVLHLPGKILIPHDEFQYIIEHGPRPSPM